MVSFADRRVVVEDYNPQWVEEFNKLKSMYEKVIGNLVISIEHVGSTSVVGLAAKPTIDIDIIIRPENFDAVKKGLASLGYIHNGDQGIKGREAFRLPNELDFKRFRHNLYVCNEDAAELKRHLAYRDYLRTHKEVMKKYGEVKKEAARLCDGDIIKYMDFKGEFVVKNVRDAMIWANIAPYPESKGCQECGSETTYAEFQMKYLGEGYKSEFFEITCGKCGNQWKQIINK